MKCDRPEACARAIEPQMVPCVVCGQPCPEPLGVCPGPLDGSRSECERAMATALLGAGLSPEIEGTA